MVNEPCFIDSSVAGFTQPATWVSQAIDMDSVGSKAVSIHIVWVDVTITWYLWRSNFLGITATAPPWDDITAGYRAIDPAWVDPVVGDALSEHIVSIVNLGAKYLRIGYSASDWTGVVGPELYVGLYRDRSFK